VFCFLTHRKNAAFVRTGIGLHIARCCGSDCKLELTLDWNVQRSRPFVYMDGSHFRRYSA